MARHDDTRSRRDADKSRAACHAFTVAAALVLAATAPPARADDSSSTALTPPPPPSSRLSPALIAGQAQPPNLGIANVESLSDAPLAQTPLSASVLTATRLAERGVDSLSAAIRDIPAASDNYNTFGYVEALQVRGFMLDEVLNYRRDGLPVTSHAPVALENKEAVEILYGASGILSGTSAPGGLVNYVLKRPTDTPLREVALSAGERGSVEAQGDLGGRFGDEGRFGYRINLAAAERRPAIRDAWSQRALASGFFDWRVARGTVVEAEVEQHDVREISVPGFGLLDTAGVGYGTTLPAPIDPRLNLNNQPWTLPFESRETTGSLRLAQQLNDDWRVVAKVGSQRVRTNDRIAFPDGCSSQPTYVYPGLCGNYDVDVYDYRSNEERRLQNGAQLQLHGRVVTGGFAHELSFGLGASHYSERYPQDQAYNFAGTIDALAPTALAPAPLPQTLNTDASRRIGEAVAFDTIRFGAGWSAWAGARAVHVAQSSEQTDGTENVNLSQHAVAPFGALGYQPWERGFAYIAAGSGVEFGAVPNRPLAFANPGEVLPVSRSRQVEVGYKQDAGNGSGWTVALFQIERPTPEVLATSGPLPVETLGAQVQRNRGVDVSATWRPTPHWLGQVGAEVLDARIRNTPDPRFEDWHATNVAPFSASTRLEWLPASLPGFAVDNLVVFSGRKPALPANLYDAGAYEVSLPSYGQWDLGLRYATTWSGLRATWTAHVDNVTDRRYWREAPTASWGATYLFPAAPRSFRVGVRLAF